MEPRLRIEMFGGLRARHDDRTIAEFPPQQSALLLALLALHPAKTHVREELIAQLWPEAATDEGRQRLRQLLYNLRRQLEQPPFARESVLVTTRTHVQLNVACVETDVQEFEATLLAARQDAEPPERIRLLTRAAHLYAGELLPGFYADFIVAERNRLAAEHQRALTELTQALTLVGELGGAIEAARRAVAHDPLCEEPYCHLMRLYAAAGQRAEAIRLFLELERRLQTELGVPASPETSRLASSILADPPVAAAEVHETVNPLPLDDVVVAATAVNGRDAPVDPVVNGNGTASAMNGHYAEPILRYVGPRRVDRRLGLHILLVVVPLLCLLLYRPRRERVESMAGAQRHGEQWVKRLDKEPGEEDSEAGDMVVDHAGNVYICGLVQIPHGGAAYVTVKYAPDGTLLAHTRYNSPFHDCDRAHSCALDSKGNLYVVGDCYNGDIDKGGTDYDIVLVKYDADLNRKWVRRYDGPGHSSDSANKVLTDDQDNVYVLGNSRRNARQIDTVLIKYDSTGNTVFQKIYNPAPEPWGSSACGPANMVIDRRAGAIYLCGYVIDPNRTLLTMKRDLNGKLLWKRRFQHLPQGDDTANMIALDGNGGVYVAGAGDDFNLHRKVGMLVHYDAAGKQLWHHIEAGEGAIDGFDGLTADRWGNLTASGWILDMRARKDLGVVQLDEMGELRWRHRLNGAGNADDYAGCTVVDAAGNVTLIGVTYSGPAELGGTQDDFVTLRYDRDGNPLWMRAYDGPVHADDRACCVVQDDHGDIYVAGQSRSRASADLTLLKYAP